MKNKSKDPVSWIGLACLALAILGNYFWNFPTWLCSILSGIFLLTLIREYQKTKEQRQQKENQRQDRIKKLGR